MIDIFFAHGNEPGCLMTSNEIKMSYGYRRRASIEVEVF